MGHDHGTPTGTTVFRVLEDPANPAAWGAFVDRYGPKIFLWCRKWGVQEADAENVTQEVLMKLFQKIQQYRPDRGGFRGWLKTVSRHALADYLAAQARGGVGTGSTDFVI